MEKVVLHSDANCFYAACEMMNNPRLREIPFAVGGSKAERKGIILTANYPAKRRGVKTGMALWEAERVCPGLLFVPPHYRVYQQYSAILNSIYNSYSDRVEEFGLDESWVSLTGCVSTFEQGVKVAHELSQRIKKETGLTVSIGVANSKVTAKLGSDLRKPDKVNVIHPDHYREIVWPLPVGDLLYVGHKTEAKLHSKGVRTIGELATIGEEYLNHWFGKVGSVLFAFANGIDLSPVAPAGSSVPMKSCGNSETCPRDLTTDEDIKIMFYLLADSVGARMREAGLAATTVSISIRDNELTSITRQCKLPIATSLSGDIAQAAFRLFKRHWSWDRNKPVRSIGVRGDDLVSAEAPVQISFEYDASKMAECETLEDTIIWLRQRYGNKVIQRGIIYTDPLLGKLDAKANHTIHPVGVFYRGGVVQWGNWKMRVSA